MTRLTCSARGFSFPAAKSPTARGGIFLYAGQAAGGRLVRPFFPGIKRKDWAGLLLCGGWGCVLPAVETGRGPFMWAPGAVGPERGRAWRKACGMMSAADARRPERAVVMRPGVPCRNMAAAVDVPDDVNGCAYRGIGVNGPSAWGISPDGGIRRGHTGKRPALPQVRGFRHAGEFRLPRRGKKRPGGQIWRFRRSRQEDGFRQGCCSSVF